MASATAKKKTNLLVIIDAQIDFHEGGALQVTGAKADCARICNLVKTKRFDNIIVTLDTHQYVDIGHPAWWCDKDGNHPGPFTDISPEDLKSGKWKTVRKSDEEWSTYYINQLHKNNRFTHTVWPYHCIVGTEGHGVQPELCEVLKAWSLKNRRLVTYMWKGTNPKAEMYSVFKADVEVPGAPETSLNTHILDRMLGYDNIVYVGQARSHCVRFSFTDMVEYFNSKKLKNVPNCVLLKDCASDIAGHEESTKQWMEDVQKQNSYVTVADTQCDWNKLMGEMDDAKTQE